MMMMMMIGSEVSDGGVFLGHFSWLVGRKVWVAWFVLGMEGGAGGRGRVGK